LSTVIPIQDFAIKVPRISWSFMERAIEIFSTLGKVAQRIPIYAKELEPLQSEGGGSKFCMDPDENSPRIRQRTDQP